MSEIFKKLQELEYELITAKEDLALISSQKPQFYIDNEDEYQEQLEIGWYVEEQVARISELEKEIKAIWDFEMSIGE